MCVRCCISGALQYVEADEAFDLRREALDARLRRAPPPGQGREVDGRRDGRSVQTLCRMCDDRCGIDVHLEDGRIVDILGNKDHLWNRGRLCVKARAAVDMVYHPDRILAPLKRTARRLAGDPPRAGARRDRRAPRRDQGAARRAQHQRVEGRGHRLRPAGDLARRFIHALGSPNYLSNDSMCYAARYFGYKLVDGAWPVPDLENARCIVLWGANPPYAHPNMTQYITAARRKGATLVVVDPRLSAIARRADIHAALRPGHRRRPRLGAHPPDRRDRAPTTRTSSSAHTVGFAKVVDYARAFTPEAVEAETGVPAATVRAIARAMARRRAAGGGRTSGNGLEHHENGVNNIRAIAIARRRCSAPWTRRAARSSRTRLPLRDLTLYDERAAEAPRPPRRRPLPGALRPAPGVPHDDGHRGHPRGRAVSAAGDDRHRREPRL